jgi:hypothetical protein
VVIPCGTHRAVGWLVGKHDGEPRVHLDLGFEGPLQAAASWAAFAADALAAEPLVLLGGREVAVSDALEAVGAAAADPPPHTPHPWCDASRKSRKRRRRKGRVASPFHAPRLRADKLPRDGRPGEAHAYPPGALANGPNTAADVERTATAYTPWDQDIVNELFRLGARPPLAMVGDIVARRYHREVPCTFVEATGALTTEPIWLPVSLVKLNYPSLNVGRR